MNNRALYNVFYLRTYIYVLGRCVTICRTYIYALGRERVLNTFGWGVEKIREISIFWRYILRLLWYIENFLFDLHHSRLPVLYIQVNHTETKPSGINTFYTHALQLCQMFSAILRADQDHPVVPKKCHSSPHWDYIFLFLMWNTMNLCTKWMWRTSSRLPSHTKNLVILWSRVGLLIVSLILLNKNFLNNFDDETYLGI